MTLHLSILVLCLIATNLTIDIPLHVIYCCFFLLIGVTSSIYCKLFNNLLDLEASPMSYTFAMRVYYR